MINGNIVQDVVVETELKRLNEAIEQSSGSQKTTMPTASASYLGKVLQYVGDTTSTFTCGYFYKCISTSVIPATAVVTTSGTAGIGTVTCDIDELGAQVGYIDYTCKLEYRPYPESITVTDTHDVERILMRDRSEDANNHYAWLTSDGVSVWSDTQVPELGTTFSYQSDGTDHAFSVYYDVVVNTYSDTYGRWQQDLDDGYYENTDVADWGISYNGVALVGAKIQIVYTAEQEGETSYSWTQINVQPA